MTSTSRDEEAMIKKNREQARTAKTPIEKLRAQCLSRGICGIKGFGKTFRIMDDNNDKRLTIQELQNGIHDYGLKLDKDEIGELFAMLDADGSGSLIFDEFLVALRPPMNQRRLNLINAAFDKLDKTGDGVVTVKDLKGVYNVRHHPKYVNGEWTENECLENFLHTFDTPNDKDGKITREEFVNYYAGVSASIDDDPYFDLMMRNAWKL
ncbi:calcyphosin-like protein [Tubulanus polymorphus]|uniref:calcyphosin-like protein n=1 Tax=Tubulanus polymorphus TaxID=672921 RepID=UPI003DA44A7A